MGRSITPPRQGAVHMVKPSEMPGAVTVKAEPTGMPRQVVTPPAKLKDGTTLDYGQNKYVAAATHDVGHASPIMPRGIMPPKQFTANQFGASGYSLDAVMMQHAKTSHEKVQPARDVSPAKAPYKGKDVDYASGNSYGIDAIKAHGLVAVERKFARDIALPKSTYKGETFSMESNLYGIDAIKAHGLVAGEKPVAPGTGMTRGITQSPAAHKDGAVDYGAPNLYGASGKAAEASTSPQPASPEGQRRGIVPPDAVTLAGSGVVGPEAVLSQHVKSMEKAKPQVGGARPTTFSLEHVEKVAEAEVPSGR